MRDWQLALVAALAAAAVALAGAFLRQRREARRHAEAEERWAERLDRREAALAAAQAELEQREDAREELDRVRRERDEERRRAARAERARAFEQELVRELRSRLHELRREAGWLGETGDVRELVLRIGLKLLEAPKGILLTRGDRAVDDRLDLVFARGFDNDPRESAVVRRFAEEVLERDQTVREPSARSAGDAETPADAEIESLVAVPLYVSDELHGVLVAANNPQGFEDFDDEVLLVLGDHAGGALRNARLRRDLRASYLGTIRVLADAIDAKDRLLRAHSEEVSGYVLGVAEQLGVEPARREELAFASLLHDVGKIGVSERILLKPGALTAEERAAVELHPRIGARLVEQVPALRSLAAPILHHHERYDGSGYPSRLAGEQIPLEARIICVADAFSAMTAERPYRAGMTLEEACEELKEGAGTQFDPQVVRLFVEELRRRPPQRGGDEGLAAAFADPELEARRGENAYVVGAGTLAATDNLTLLYSRRYLDEALRAESERASLRGEPFALVLVDLPLGRINADRGLQAGDAALQAAAAALEEQAVACGGVAARFSGRRLALLLPAGAAARAEAVARTLRERVAADVGASVAAAVSADGDAAGELVERVRAAAAAAAAAAADGGVATSRRSA